MRDLDEKKILVLSNNLNEVVTVRILFVSADSPAKAKFLKLKQFNGEFGCTPSKYIISSDKYSLRTHASTVALMKLFVSTGKEILGVMGVSPMIGFKDYDLIRGIVIDFLHCVLEGLY